MPNPGLRNDRAQETIINTCELSSVPACWIVNVFQFWAWPCSGESNMGGRKIVRCAWHDDADLDLADTFNHIDNSHDNLYYIFMRSFLESLSY